VRTTDPVGVVLVDEATGEELSIAYADVEHAVVQVELRPKRDHATDVGADGGSADLVDDEV
jgi:hypothetical protein